MLCCTAEWWRSDCAGRAGRSRRPRPSRVSVTASTRIGRRGWHDPTSAPQPPNAGPCEVPGGGNSTACRCSFKSRVRQADTSLKGELDLRRIPDGNCQGNSGARIGVQARVTHDSPCGHKSEEVFFPLRDAGVRRPGCLRWHSEFRRQSWIELTLRFSDSCGFHCSDLRFASLGLRPVRTNSLPKSGFLKQLCRTGVLPEVPLERPCSPGIRPNGLFHQGTRFRTITPATVAHVKRNNPEHQQAVRRRKR